MAVYVLPNFNITCNVWRFGNAITNAPDLTPTGNLSPGRLTGVDEGLDPKSANTQGVMWLRLPAHTDVRDGKDVNGPDVIEAPAGSGKFYNCVWVDDIGTGFTNEHRFAALVGRGPWAVPFGTGGSVSGGGSSSYPNTFFQASGAASMASPLKVPATIPAQSSYIVYVGQMDNTNTPAINGATPPIVPGQQTITHVGHTLTVSAHLLFATQNLPGITVAPSAGGPSTIMVIVEVVLPRFNAKQQQLSNGNGFAPNIAMLNNPFGAPLREASYVLGAALAPGGFTPGAPWAATGLLNVTVAGVGWWMQTGFLGGPPNTPPVPTFTPIGGWSEWGAVSCDFV